MSKSIYEMFATDANLETKGRWYRIGDSEFLLARAGGSNTKFTQAYAAAMRPYQKQQQLGMVTEEQARGIMAEPFARYVLLDWRTRRMVEGKEVVTEGVIDGQDGSPMSYSYDAARALMLAIPDLLITLIDAAASFANYAPDDKDAAVKN